ncbi:probable cytochrome P450 301a1, mitochondrial isoform X2 [Schistocerca nitens]|uniref:probable cytochrome P450 301a1, mitochondrial isoform X2 n=1 Tax=Schistocerca nitens TaxID=7011 RepID=UPI002117BCDE|nr:probable cytochrome P450 301a1, mitochondrial isoform X2 [Schistocerca nitens]
MTGAALSAARRACSGSRRLLSLPPPAAPATTPACGRWLATVAASAETPPSSPSQEWLSARPFEEMPGPKKLPIIGNLWNFIPKIGEMSNQDLNELNDFLWKRYGDLVKLDGIPGRPISVILFNANDIEKAFRNEGPWPHRTGLQSMLYYRKHVRPDWFRDRCGVAVTQGEEWYNFRRKVNQPLMQPRSAKLYVGPIDQVAEDFVNRMVLLRDENLEMPDNFLNELYKWALESVSLVALDARLGCLEPDFPPDSEPQKLIDTVQVLFDSIYKLEFRLSPWKVISTPTWRRFVRGLDYFYETSMKYINAAMERIKAKGENSTGDLSVLERLLLQNDDPVVACVMALDMMFAGVDTTSNAAVACLYYVAKNPEAQQRLFEEVHAQLPESQSQPLTASKLEECRYLRACFREAMRLKPIAPGNARRVLTDDFVLGGYRIPKGVDLVMGHPQLSVSEQYFPQADQFRPERWLKGPDGRSEAQDAHPFASMPFGFGPRMCIGRRFAELEVYTLVARIIRRFRLEFHGDIKWNTGLIQFAASPLKFKAIDRDR